MLTNNKQIFDFKSYRYIVYFCTFHSVLYNTDVYLLKKKFLSEYKHELYNEYSFERCSDYSH